MRSKSFIDICNKHQIKLGRLDAFSVFFFHRKFVIYGAVTAFVEVLSWPSLAFELFGSAGTGLAGLCPRCPSEELGQLPALMGAVVLLVSPHVG